MDTLTTLLILGVAAQGIAFAALILAPPLYAWTDRWLDRTHKTTAHEDQDQKTHFQNSPPLLEKNSTGIITRFR